MTALPTLPSLPAGHIATAAEWQQLMDCITFTMDPPHAQVRQTSGQSISTGTFTSILFDAEDFDSHAQHSTSSNTSRFTAVYPGVYQVSGKVGFNNGSATGRRATTWLKNGSTINGAQIAVTAGDDTGDMEIPAVTLEIYLAVTDYVELQGYQDSGGSMNTIVTAQTQSLMCVRWVRSTNA